MRSDSPCTVGGAGGGGIHNQVVDDTIVYPRGLETSHSANPVGPAALPGGGDLGLATDPDPQHRKICQG